MALRRVGLADENGFCIFGDAGRRNWQLPAFSVMYEKAGSKPAFSNVAIILVGATGFEPVTPAV